MDGKPCVSAVLLSEKGEWFVAISEELPPGRRIGFYEAAAVHLGALTFGEKLKDKER